MLRDMLTELKASLRGEGGLERRKAKEDEWRASHVTFSIGGWARGEGGGRVVLALFYGN